MRDSRHSPGAAHIDFESAMKLEHCDNPCSDEPFKASNYDVETTSRLEWTYVKTPERCPAHQRGEGRTIKNLDDLMKETATISAKLIPAEVIATVLYTGPMVCDYLSCFFCSLVLSKYDLLSLP